MVSHSRAVPLKQVQLAVASQICEQVATEHSKLQTAVPRQLSFWQRPSRQSKLH